MNLMLKTVSVFVLLFGWAAVASAQVDNFGSMDTVFADLAKIDANNWSITISCSNDERIEGMSVPLKMTAGLNRIVADSAIFTGGRVEHFAYKAFRPDTAIQCITIGLLANMSPTKNFLAPGAGRLVTVFVSSLEDKPLEQLAVDTTTTSPGNTLMAVAYRFQESGDTVPAGRSEILTIKPAFVVRQPK